MLKIKQPSHLPIKIIIHQLQNNMSLHHLILLHYYLLQDHHLPPHNNQQDQEEEIEEIIISTTTIEINYWSMMHILKLMLKLEMISGLILCFLVFNFDSCFNIRDLYIFNINKKNKKNLIINLVAFHHFIVFQ